MPTIAGFPCKVLWDRYQKGSNDRGPWISKSVMIPWGDANDFVNAVMGGPDYAAESPNLQAVAVDVEGLGEGPADDADTPSFQLAVCAITYGTRTWDESPGTVPEQAANQFDPSEPIALTIQEIDWSEELIRVGVGAYKFEGLPALTVTSEMPVYNHVSRATLRVVRKKVQTLPWPIIRDRMNKVNSTEIFDCEAGTLRFAGCKTRREFSSDGSINQELDYTFEWREHPWGQFPRPDDGTFDYVSIGGTPGIASGLRPYESAELRDLFTT